MNLIPLPSSSNYNLLQSGGNIVRKSDGTLYLVVENSTLGAIEVWKMDSSEFITKWTVSGDATARTIQLPTVSGGTFNYTVDWGDGTAPVNITTYNSANRIHTYAANGTYFVRIAGTMGAWNFNTGLGYTSNTKLNGILQWGDVSFYNLVYGFYNCTLQLSAQDSINYSGTSIAHLFERCNCGVLELSANIFKKCVNVTDASYLFYLGGYCRYPSELFKNCPLITTLSNAFAAQGSVPYAPPSDILHYCPLLTDVSFAFYHSDMSEFTVIPTDFFRYNPLITTFEAVFASSNGYITTIPTDLFRYNPLATSFKQAFYFQTRLVNSPPTDLFRYNPLVNNFYGTFGYCKFTSIPTDLFRYNPLVTTFREIFAGTAITAIPVDIFRYNTLVESFEQAFYNCNSLASLPTDLFRYNPSVTTFYQALASNYAFTTLPNDLFRYNTLVTNFSNVFNDCSKLTSLPTDLFTYNTLVTNFTGSFSACTSLATVPNSLFKYNTVADSFYMTFSNCPKLQLNANIFYGDGEQATRFLNQSPNFQYCFNRSSFTGVQGVAPDLWNCTFGTGTPIKTLCFGGAGNSLTSISNYASIPSTWKA